MDYIILSILLFSVTSTLVSSARIPPNPCPQIFSYFKDSGGQIYGEAVIPYDGMTTLQFSVNASLAALFQKAELRLQLLTPLRDLVDNTRTVTYNVFFPSQEIIPKITQITYNGQVYCQGSPEPLIPGTSGVTNIWYTTIFKFTRPSGTFTNQVYDTPGISDTEIPVKNPSVHRPSSQTTGNYPVTESTVSQTSGNRPITQQLPVSQTSGIHPSSQRPVENPSTPTQHPDTPEPETNTSPPFKDPNTLSLDPYYIVKDDSTDVPNSVVPAPISPGFLPPTPPRNTEDVSKCGISNNLVVPLILGGIESDVGQFPWLTALFALSSQGNYEYKCTATLISEKHVITAGRCVQYYNVQVVKTEDILLVMGTNDLENWASNGAITRKAKKVVTHPDFKKNPDSAHADMSVITMDVPLTFSSVIRPVCLWTGDSDLYPITKKMGMIAGYGQDEEAQKSGKLHVLKAKHTKMPIVSQFDCLLSNVAFTNITSDKTFCAGGKGSGPCIGDSGSGFVLQIDGVYYLRGIASFSLSKDGKCELQDKFAVFCDVAKFMDWVKSCMRN